MVIQNIIFKILHLRFGNMHHLPYYYSPEQLKSYHNGILSAAAAAAGSSSLFSIDNILAPRPIVPPRPYFPYPSLPPTPHDIFGKFLCKCRLIVVLP